MTTIMYCENIHHRHMSHYHHWVIDSRMVANYATDVYRYARLRLHLRPIDARTYVAGRLTQCGYITAPVLTRPYMTAPA